MIVTESAAVRVFVLSTVKIAIRWLELADTTGPGMYACPWESVQETMLPELE